TDSFPWMHSPVSAFNDALDTRVPIATTEGSENTILDRERFGVVVVIREMRLKLVCLDIPEGKHILVSHVLLERAQHILSHLPVIISGFNNCLEQLRMHQQLPRVEHRPVMGVTMLRNTPPVRLPPLRK